MPGTRVPRSNSFGRAASMQSAPHPVYTPNLPLRRLFRLIRLKRSCRPHPGRSLCALGHHSAGLTPGGFAPRPQGFTALWPPAFHAIMLLPPRRVEQRWEPIRAPWRCHTTWTASLGVPPVLTLQRYFSAGQAERSFRPRRSRAEESLFCRPRGKRDALTGSA